jgi:peptidoglycan/LPS O-acetylase OafA/YrhL
MPTTALLAFRREPWRSMGRYSFAIYLGHMPIIIAVLIIAGGPASDWSEGILLVVAVLLILPGFVWALRNLVEQPVYRWLTGREPPLA